eukprot:TRINITY_DN13839_c0_g1_i1.p1 TRINITY_DN13839_c0_g1~~TRINITY_DN13839_c0_g1_i1.p1  ORF type:complete len:80 (+),score=8.47 TRINITY_DN13839_c0_g1_i1:127-366(+)
MSYPLTRHNRRVIEKLPRTRHQLMWPPVAIITTECSEIESNLTLGDEVKYVRRFSYEMALFRLHVMKSLLNALEIPQSD